MRQMVDTAAYAPPGSPAFGGGWYDRKTLRWKSVVDVTLIAAMGPPGGGRQARIPTHTLDPTLAC